MNAIEVTNFYKNLPCLETSRLVLRKITNDDVADIFIYASDSEVTRYLRWGPHQLLVETENYVNEVLVQYREGLDGPWGIENKADCKVIGHIHLMEIDVYHKKAQVGFVLAKSYWNQGIMTEALEKVVEYSFEELGLNRLEALCISENQAAIRVLEKVGMKEEGVLRQYLFQKGTYWEFVICAILRREFGKRLSNTGRLAES